MEKYFVVDTNVLLHDARSLFAFGDNRVVIPIDVLEELDKFKGENNELGRNAREVVRTLDRFRQGGNLGTGGAVEEFTAKGTLTIEDALYPNEFVLLRDEARPKHTVLARRTNEEAKRIEPLRTSGDAVAGVSARNMEQRLALELLLDDTVP